MRIEEFDFSNLKIQLIDLNVSAELDSGYHSVTSLINLAIKNVEFSIVLNQMVSACRGLNDKLVVGFLVNSDEPYRPIRRLEITTSDRVLENISNSELEIFLNNSDLFSLDDLEAAIYEHFERITPRVQIA